METLSINLLNPKARQLLADLADLKLIEIKPQKSWTKILERLREKELAVPSLDEIAKEVKAVRKARYAHAKKP